MACDTKTMLLISCYADGETTPEETALAREHLEQCPQCRALVEDWEGQRRVFEWTYSMDVPEETQPEWRSEMAEEVRRIPAAWKLAGVWEWLRGRSRGFAWAGTLAVLVVFGFLAYQRIALQMSLPPMIETGTQVVTANHAERARMNDDVDLQIGPGSRVYRVDNRTIRLDKGWVSATVRNNAGIRVLSQRLEVVDRGTEFRVGTSRKMDCVTVQRGLVEVKTPTDKQQVRAGQALVTEDGRKLQVVDLPKKEPGDRGVPLDKVHPAFVPSNERDADWQEGLGKLAKQFPDARLLTGSVTSGRTTLHGLPFYSGQAQDAGLADGLRAHYMEVALGLAGEDVGPGEWSIPVGFFQVGGSIVEPSLPGDVYYVQLVPNNGKVVWRLTGARGESAELPMATVCRTGNAASGFWGESAGTRFPDRYVYKETRYIAAWPGEVKPSFALELRGAHTQAESEKEAMLAQARSVITEGDRCELENGELLYLDPARRHRILLAWNKNVGKQLCRLSDKVEQGRGGSVVIGAFATDMPLVEPKAGPGVYLVQFVVSDPNKAPYIALTTADGKEVFGWDGSSYRLPKMELGDGIDQLGYPSDVPSGYGGVMPVRIVTPADNNAFAIGFKLDGRAEGQNPDRFVIRTNDPEACHMYVRNAWAEGWIKVSEP